MLLGLLAGGCAAPPMNAPVTAVADSAAGSEIAVWTPPSGGRIAVTVEHAVLGERFRLVATADGEKPFTYQWLKDGLEVGGGGAELEVSRVDWKDAGTYACYVGNSAGEMPSNVILLFVRSR